MEYSIIFSGLLLQVIKKIIETIKLTTAIVKLYSANVCIFS
ncbi:protein of unknown function [Oenococcus oeni]|nr:hypothetical protein OENI_20122 [Oenococcus oeni]SYW03928.1 hypothetical protein OENI_90060 [Oenococcus oeni]VDC14583.1 protein of unknown function [Oenococcus oeni]